MNKQEVIEKLEYLKLFLEEGSKDNCDHGFINALTYALKVTKDLDEPEKPVVPQYVADFYESIKDVFESGVYDLCAQFYEDKSQLSDELSWWFKHDDNKPIETLVKMKIFGYEVEKEKFYIVEILNPNDR